LEQLRKGQTCARSCRGREGFEGARDALTLSLRIAALAWKPRRVSGVFVSVFGILLLCKSGPLSLVREPFVLDVRTRDFGIKYLCTCV
jgi:hypothetical protein